MSDNLAYQEERREELIGGKVVMMSPASTNHTFVSGNIHGIFWHYLKGKKCTPISDGSTVYLTDDDHFVPDFMVVCDPDKIKSDGIHGAPDLVVEVLSPSTMRNDKTRKKDVYARCGPGQQVRRGLPHRRERICPSRYLRPAPRLGAGEDVRGGAGRAGNPFQVQSV